MPWIRSNGPRERSISLESDLETNKTHVLINRLLAPAHRPLPFASFIKPSAMQTFDDSHNVLHERLDGVMNGQLKNQQHSEIQHRSFGQEAQSRSIKCPLKMYASFVQWEWEYRSEGETEFGEIRAEGTFITNDDLDGDGWFEIVSISGQYNHDTITGLFPAGESISGNSPFEGDNLIRVSDRNNPQPEAQLSGDGFQFSLDDGSFVMSFSHRSLRPLVILSFTAETLSRRERCCRLLKSTCGLKRNLMLLEQHTPVARW